PVAVQCFACAFLSTVVGVGIQISVQCGLIDPSENQPILLVDPDGVPPSQFSFQIFKPVSEWDRKIGFLSGRIQDLQFSEQDSADSIGNAAVTDVMYGESLQPGIAELECHCSPLWYAQCNCASMSVELFARIIGSCGASWGRDGMEMSWFDC